MVAEESAATQIDFTSADSPGPKNLDRAYGFDDVAIVPGAVTVSLI